MDHVTIPSNWSKLSNKTTLATFYCRVVVQRNTSSFKLNFSAKVVGSSTHTATKHKLYGFIHPTEWTPWKIQPNDNLSKIKCLTLRASSHQLVKKVAHWKKTHDYSVEYMMSCWPSDYWCGIDRPPSQVWLPPIAKFYLNRKRGSHTFQLVAVDE